MIKDFKLQEDCISAETRSDSSPASFHHEVGKVIAVDM